jgi:cytochrome c biogenesis protein CcdA/thiol-disulfide isomerase/thioredoxin
MEQGQVKLSLFFTMILLIIFAFLAGIVTILSPCILPILPIILSSGFGTVQTGKGRPLGVITGFILSFTFFTLFLSTIVGAIGIPADYLRLFSVAVIALFGVSMLIPKFQIFLEILFSKLSQFLPQSQNSTGFGGGIIIGLSLGLLWTPCVGPILASVISLAITGAVTLDAFFITLAYSLGTAIPMFFIMIAGQTALRRAPWLLNNASKIQQGFGILMILTAIAIFLNFDRSFQTFILNTFPNYGTGLTKFEDNPQIQNALQKLSGEKIEEKKVGKAMFDLAPKGDPAPEIIPGGEWFNSPPLTLKSLRGKVVLIDFWTYSCINCQRTLPYLKSWWEKYKDKGLVIIGVHAPEFEFEKNPKNVEKAIADFGLTYPVVQDNNFETWRAYSNRYWPAKYFIDKDGQIRSTHFGEGDYDESEKIIQELLSETGTDLSQTEISNPEYKIYAQTPESYLGYDRMEFLASPDYLVRDALGSYTSPKNLSENQFAFTGDWNVMDQYSNPQKGAGLLFNFSAKNVYLVMRAKSGESKVKVFVDDKQQFPGKDVEDGVITVNADTLYELVDLPDPGRHILRLEFLDSNTEVYAFTFG